MKKVIICFVLFAFVLVGDNLSVENKSKVYDKAEDICPLKIGEEIPDANVKSIEDNEVSIRKVVGKKPAIIIFYRGGWCPFCNMQLAQIATIEEKLYDLGYEIIGLSMDKPEKLLESKAEYELKYSLYSDSKAFASKAFGIAFKAAEGYVSKLKTEYKMDIEKASGETHHILPVPAVFIVKEGTIRFQYVNPDYKIRLNENILLAAAENIINDE